MLRACLVAALLPALLGAQSIDDFQLPPKSAFSSAMPRYPNVWFYVDAAMVPSHDAAVKLVTQGLRNAMRLPEYYPPFDNPEGCDFEVRVEHLQAWIDPARRSLQHAHAFHLRYYYSALARPDLAKVRYAGREFYRFAASVHYEVEHANPHHADVETCPICGRAGAYASVAGNLVEQVHDPLGLELLLTGKIRGEVVRHEDWERRPFGSVESLRDKFAVSSHVFPGQTQGRNTLRVGTVVFEPKPKRMAITIDDLPYVGRTTTLARGRVATQKILDALKEAGAPAVGFVNENKMEPAESRAGWTKVLEQWLDRGMPLGNHTYSHWDLNNTPLEKYQEDVIRGETVTRDLMRRRGNARFYFRHPFTHSGDTKEKKVGLEKFLASRGYTIAPFTVEHADYFFNQVFERLHERADKAQAERVRQAYIDHLDVVLDYYERLGGQYFGRDIAQVLLIHANELNALCLPEMLGRMKRRGYSFISLDEALEDSAYRTPDEYVGKIGPSWLHRWSIALGKTFDLPNEPDPPVWLFELNKRLSSPVTAR